MLLSPKKGEKVKETSVEFGTEKNEEKKAECEKRSIKAFIGTQEPLLLHIFGARTSLRDVDDGFNCCNNLGPMIGG